MNRAFNKANEPKIDTFESKEDCGGRIEANRLTLIFRGSLFSRQIFFSSKKKTFTLHIFFSLKKETFTLQIFSRQIFRDFSPIFKKNSTNYFLCLN